MLVRRFNRAMAALGPFEPEPALAVAVSGGADSMALACLVRDWAEARGGTVTALTVDHRLRPEAAQEARWVRDALAPRGIAHRVLAWRAGADGVRANLQARARAARYALMSDWCRAHGVLHLLTAHHQTDQAETFLLRFGRGSGTFGLAGMAAQVEHPHLRLLRPLMEIPGADLRTALSRAGIEWIEDPSNADAAFARVRVRRALPGLEAAGLTPARIFETAARLGRDRQVLEGSVARLLALAASPDPAGFVRLDRTEFLAAPRPVGLRALARVLGAVGGAEYAPRFERLERLYDEIAGSGRARTLGGCTIRSARGGLLLFCREPAAQEPPLAVSGPGSMIWDRRFFVRLAATRGTRSKDRSRYSLAPLGQEGWTAIKGDARGYGGRPDNRPRPLPDLVRTGLPALRRGGRVVEVPHLGYRRFGAGVGTLTIAETRPLPPGPLAGAEFGLTGLGHGG
jgi:tRNA(Ile)-lysidine synthase